MIADLLYLLATLLFIGGGLLLVAAFTAPPRCDCAACREYRGGRHR